jgi:hypothetical protein
LTTSNLPTTSVHRTDAAAYDAVKRALTALPLCEHGQDWGALETLPDERLLMAFSRQFPPMQPTPETVKPLVAMLTGAYSANARPDMKGITPHLQILFSQYPEHVVQQAIIEVPREHEFLSVKAVSETLVRVASDHAEMQRRARVTLEEVRRRNSGERALMDKRDENERVRKAEFDAMVDAIAKLTPWQRERLIARVRATGTEITDSMAAMNTMLAAAAKIAGITASNLTEGDAI